MKNILLIAGVLLASACVFQPVDPDPAPPVYSGGDPNLNSEISCVDASGNFAPCE